MLGSDKYQQHVTYATRNAKTLDSFYFSVKDAYSSLALLALGHGDRHNLVHHVLRHRLLVR